MNAKISNTVQELTRRYGSFTVSIFELISAHFVDVFYNALYERARTNQAKGTVASVTEAYRQMLRRYNDHATAMRTRDTFFKETINGISTFNRYTIYGVDTTSFLEKINRLATVFIPEDFRESVNETHKTQLLLKIFQRMVVELSQEIYTVRLAHIIDERYKHEQHVRSLQDCADAILANQRDDLYRQFIAPETRRNISQSAYVKMHELSRELAAKLAAERQRVKAAAMIIQEKNRTIAQLRAQLDGASEPAPRAQSERAQSELAMHGDRVASERGDRVASERGDRVASAFPRLPTVQDVPDEPVTHTPNGHPFGGIVDMRTPSPHENAPNGTYYRADSPESTGDIVAIPDRQPSPEEYPTDYI